MAISNLQKILKARNMNFEEKFSPDDTDSDEILRLMFKYMEESFSSIIQHLEIVNKNQVLLLEQIRELKKEE